MLPYSTLSHGQNTGYILTSMPMPSSNGIPRSGVKSPPISAESKRNGYKIQTKEPCYFPDSIKRGGMIFFILPRFIYDLIQSLIDNIEPAIRNQHFGYLYTFGGLVILQQGCHDTGQCQSAAVQCMTQNAFSYRLHDNGISTDWPDSFRNWIPS